MTTRKLLVVVLLLHQTSGFTYQQTGYWETTDCSGAPFYMDIFPEFNCGQRNITYNCSPYTFNNTKYYRTVICVEDTREWAKSYYKTTDYILMEQFAASSGNCSDYLQGRVFLGNDSCVKMINSTLYQSAIASVYTDGPLSLKLFDDSSCSPTAAKKFSINSSTLTDHSCYNREFKFFSESEYTSNSGSSSESEGSTSDSHSESKSNSGSASAIIGEEEKSSSGLQTGIVVILAILSLIVAIGIGWLIFWWGRRSAAQKHESTGVTDDSFVNMGQGALSRTADEMLTSSDRLWRDEAILGARVPREKVIIQQLISRGGYGEVYSGLYNGQQVAIKMLVPETRKSEAHRSTFLTEIKLMAILEHPRIVYLVGVAWDSPNDLCALLEFMEGGDLRTLLNKYSKEHRPTGFTFEKVQIALHVAHALTYLHSLDPPVIHRDLKSKNILLSQDLDAKLTDFGVSRERADRTMTAAVGTSLWMAPEVMMGLHYDDKADIFSFGIVLSELSTHCIPYTHAKARDGIGGRMPDTAVLQLVAAGKLQADFSQCSFDSLLQLGQRCASVDPKLRPAAPEVLYHLHTAMKNM
ncbi:hypothetical protein V7S43_008991 [Phytophthora oleae]|uniref:Protein kinase domain-containing protein n=1 Tax=Phytophthora oleae TaxID=2107226 RepID=A0ABD3FHE8_9STRA